MSATLVSVDRQRRAADPADARRRARPSERRRGPGAGRGPRSAPARRRCSCSWVRPSAAWWAGSCSTRSSAAGACSSSALAAGITAGACTVAVCALTLRSPDYGAFRQPTFYAHGGDLPRLLALSDRLTAAGDSYQSSYQQALTGLDTLVAAAAGDRPAVEERSFMVASDIHANWLTLPAFARYSDHRPVFLVGDFALQGTPIEASIAQRAADARPPDGRRFGKPRLTGRHAEAGRGRGDRPHPRRAPRGRRHACTARRSSRSTACWSPVTRILWRRRRGASATGSI